MDYFIITGNDFRANTNAFSVSGVVTNRKVLNNQGYTEIKKGFSVEIYTINPNDSSNPANWLTEIYIPIH